MPGGMASAEQKAGASGTLARDEVLRALVSAVSRHDLQAPALFVLEAARPFHLLLQQALYVAHPLLRPWLGDRPAVWAELLDDPGTLEQARQLLARRGWPRGR